jgi:hypothetical protein
MVFVLTGEKIELGCRGPLWSGVRHPRERRTRPRGNGRTGHDRGEIARQGIRRLDPV